ncbi:TIGR00299 family protein [candidate division LCP-89 bacterium B3_LCP]|uniref:Putative nickel insertion protein n=1 Tax=candidate division LCP-89 bacterium B3_LCP TaxID=2012998 RepID=A0A532UYM8_UNCL8|nr:MAG: TIGR00299 family protein [candidate division LCP-89 bacterium B3_LCP]
MKVLYFDAYSGVAGDMILASLFDLGVDFKQWQQKLSGLSVGGYKVNIKNTKRHSIKARQVIIKVTEKQPKRHLADVQKIITSSDLSDYVKENALNIFEILAHAEAEVHGCGVEEVHFHEVGAVDAIVDIVGTCIALEMLKVKRIYSSPVGVGKGLSKSAHGPMALPPPATLKILESCPLKFHDIEGELATPTGSAIIKALAVFDTLPEALSLSGTGYGAGSKKIAQIPNVLRSLLLQSVGKGEIDRALLIETNIDDMNPEMYPYVIEKLLGAGAMDAFLIPVIMKKGRPGLVLSVLCDPEEKETIVDIIYSETSTLGIRISSVERLKLARKAIVVKTPFGDIKGKEAVWKGKIRRTPEFESCKEISEKAGVPLGEIYQAFFSSLSSDN